MTADTRTITVEQLAAALHTSLPTKRIEDYNPADFYGDYAATIFDALPAACCCIEGNDIMLTTCATNACPEHGASEADRLVVAMVTAEYAPKDGDGDYQNYAAYGAWLDALAAARAYIERKGLA